MRVHFREKYGTKGEEILYVTPAGILALPNSNTTYTTPHHTTLTLTFSCLQLIKYLEFSGQI